MSLGECMLKHTHRQYLVWVTWLEEEWNRPDRTDTYLQQIACEVRRSGSSKPRQVKMEHFKLQFQEPKPPLTRKQAADQSKAKWLGLMTAKVVHVTKA